MQGGTGVKTIGPPATEESFHLDILRGDQHPNAGEGASGASEMELEEELEEEETPAT